MPNPHAGAVDYPLPVAEVYCGTPDDLITLLSCRRGRSGLRVVFVKAGLNVTAAPVDVPPVIAVTATNSYSPEARRS